MYTVRRNVQRRICKNKRQKRKIMGFEFEKYSPVYYRVKKDRKVHC